DYQLMWKPEFAEGHKLDDSLIRFDLLKHHGTVGVKVANKKVKATQILEFEALTTTQKQQDLATREDSREEIYIHVDMDRVQLLIPFPSCSIFSTSYINFQNHTWIFQMDISDALF
ncbi:hypothetical protein ACJX0J_007262, partial [Zea mays]